VKIHISNGNSKMGKIPSLSLRPVKDCVECSRCKKRCYALKAWRNYPSTRKAWGENSKLLRTSPDRFWAELSSWLWNHKPAYFRFHVAGDVLGVDHAAGIVQISKSYPKTKFMLFTKNLNAAKNMRALSGNNLSVIYSVWQGQDPGRETTLPLSFAGDCSNYGERFKKAIECPGNCEACGVCWDLAKKGMDVKFDIH
jgi:ferredoxin